jgi:hypothetical protein
LNYRNRCTRHQAAPPGGDERELPPETGQEISTIGGDEFMGPKSPAVILAVQLGLAAGFVAAQGATANAQTVTAQTVAIKSGETLELQSLYWVQNCRSVAIGKPEAEILEGPPDVKVTVKEGDVVPRSQGCSNKIKGGTLFLTAPQEIDDSGAARLVIRVKFKTKDGDRMQSLVYNLSLIP